MCIFLFSNEFSALSGFLQMTLFPQKEKMDNLETLKLDTTFWSCLKKNICTKDLLEIRRAISKFKAGRGEHLRKEKETRALDSDYPLGVGTIHTSLHSDRSLNRSIFFFYFDEECWNLSFFYLPFFFCMHSQEIVSMSH